MRWQKNCFYKKFDIKNEKNKEVEEKTAVVR